MNSGQSRHPGTICAIAGLVVLLQGCTPPVSGFQPLYPKHNSVVRWSMSKTLLRTERSATVNSLQPTLKWRAQATNGYDVIEIPYVSVDLESVKDLRFELIIWNVVAGQRGDIVYQASDLVNNEHTVRTPLAPNKYYFWSVRARFSVDGKTRITEWTISDHPCNPVRFSKVRPGLNVCGRELARSTGRIHPNHYLHFKTPSAEQAVQAASAAVGSESRGETAPASRSVTEPAASQKQEGRPQSSSLGNRRQEISDGTLNAAQINALLPSLSVALPHTVQCSDFDNLGGDSCHVTHKFRNAGVVHTKTVGHSGSSRENGRWWTQGDDLLCLKWPSWFEGNQRCYKVARAGKKLTLKDSNSRPIIFLIENN